MGRALFREISHAIEHIENGNIELAISLLKMALANNERQMRKGDKDGGHTKDTVH